MISKRFYVVPARTSHRTAALNQTIHVAYDTFKIVCLPEQQTLTEVRNVLHFLIIINRIS